MAPLCTMLSLTPSDLPLVCDVSANSKACSGPDVGLLIGAMVIALILLWCVYCVVERDSRAKRRDSFALLSRVCSQLVSLFQMLGVLNALSVVWPEPFATIVKLGTITNFRLEVLNLGCVLSTPPLHRYAANVFMFVPLTLCMVCCHFVHTMVFHFDQFTRAHCRQFASTLFGAVGTVFMSIYISVCSAIAQPLQCDMHPNGVSTVQAYRQVTCWDPESEHQHMLTIGALASVVPLAFLSLCAWVTYSLPRRLRQGDTEFLHTFTFLLFRFRPGAYQYVLVLLLRNFALAVVPMVPDLASEIFASATVVVACTLLSVSMSPWAVHQANHLDVAMHTGLLLILLLAALQTNSVDEITVGNLLVAVFSAVMCAFLGASAWSLRLCALRLRKPFQFFLCHHKVGGGAFCRLLKVRLLGNGQVTRGVFLDSDNLQDLSLLFGIVGEKTETLVVLCTREILHRPWCVGEMTTARLHNIDTILVMFPDFEKPSRTFIDNYAGVEGVQSLAPFGISLQMTQETLWWLGTRPWIVLPRSINSSGVDAVVEKLVGRKKGRQEMATVPSVLSIINSHGHNDNEEDEVCHWRSRETVSHLVSEPRGWSTPAAVTVVSIVDHTNQESVCTALLVRELLKRFFPLTGPGHVLGPDENLPASATLLLVMSSNGCFQRPSFVRQLFQAASRGIGAIPVIVDDSFQFPSDAFFQELRALSVHILSATGMERDADELITLIKKLFEEIGIHVRPQDSQAVVEVGDVILAQHVEEMSVELATRWSPCQSHRNYSNRRPNKKKRALFRTHVRRTACCRDDVCRHATLNRPLKTVKH